jgi:hypothetical protein
MKLHTRVGVLSCFRDVNMAAVTCDVTAVTFDSAAVDLDVVAA